MLHRIWQLVKLAFFQPNLVLQLIHTSVREMPPIGEEQQNWEGFNRQVVELNLRISNLGDELFFAEDFEFIASLEAH